MSINTEQPGTPFFDLAMRYARHGGVVLDINPFSLAGRAPRRRRRGPPAARRRAVDGPLARARARRDRSTSRSWAAARRAARRSSAAPAGCCGSGATDLRFFSWHRPIDATTSRRSSPSAAPSTTSLAADADPAQRPPRRRAVLRVGADRRGRRQRLRRRDRDVGRASSRSSPVDHLLMAPLESLAEEAVALAFDEPRRAAMADAAYEVLRRDLDQSTLLSSARSARRASSPSIRPARAQRDARRVRDRPRRTVGRARLRRTRGATAGVRRRSSTCSVHTPRDAEAGLPRRARQRPRHRTRAGARPLRRRRPRRRPSRRRPGRPRRPTVSVVDPAVRPGPLPARGGRVGRRLRADRLAAVGARDRRRPLDRRLAARSRSELLAEQSWLPITADRPLGERRPPGRPQHRLRRGARPLRVRARRRQRAVPERAARRSPPTSTRRPPRSSRRTGCSSGSTRPASVGLTSHLPWDVELLVHGAYIDAMAMFRRSAWEALGGYAVGRSRVYGWEDYDLWLAAAERGLAGGPRRRRSSAGTVSSRAPCARSATSTCTPTS